MPATKPPTPTPRRGLLLATAIIAIGGLGLAAHGQVIGSYDNFDCFNDTGTEAEGFEIDVEDVSPSDLTREFPSNFGSQPWVIRYGLPTVTAYDWTSATADPAHAYDQGHKGVLITWAATLQGGKWVASQGNAVAQGAPGAAGNGTPYNPKPTLTSGDSCWWWGLGATYPDSGCDHFGVSFAAGVAPGRLTYHWKIPDPTNTVLINAPLEASIPPSPSLAPVPVAAGAPPVVQAVAQAPDDVGGDPYVQQEQEPQFGPAYWLKTTTFYLPNKAVLENLQIHLLNQLKLPKGAKKVITWTLLQRAPAGQAEHEDNEQDNVPGKNVQVTKVNQYYKFNGAYDSETHEVLCGSFYATAADAQNGANAVASDCTNSAGNLAPYTKGYYTIDDGTGAVVYVAKGNLGTYVGAHVNAYNLN